MNVKDLAARLRRRLHRAGVESTPALVAQLDAYLTLLELWNRKINLTALTDVDEAIDRLIVEPLLALKLVGLGEGSAIDIGSGGGSPAIPLKLAAPAWRMRMIESKTRKAAFLRETIRQLGLVDCTVETSRYEELLTRPELHESADILTIRAVRVEGRTLTGLQAFVRPGGKVLWFRGPVGPDTPTNLTPPLLWEATYPLVESLRSRLVVLRKAAVGWA